ncbi:MAG TPA: SpoIIE family protein phosphatase, partial [Candidatus Acidoferrum sp.]|nr:SpoIIE family protein phosphatase [Candidatus Acidoferrum sp.]
ERAVHISPISEAGCVAAVQLLERVDEALIATTDPRTSFGRLAGLIVPELGDLCVVWISDTAPRALAVRHVDPRLESLAAELLERYPLRKGTPLEAAMHAEEAVLCGVIAQGTLDALAQDEQHLTFLREVAPRSAVLVPLRFGDGVRGLILVATSGERRLTTLDRTVLTILARRVAAAYEVDRLRAEDRRTTGYFRVLSEAGRLFTESFDLQRTLDAFVKLSVPELADAVAVNLVDEDGVTRTAALDVGDPAHRPLLERLRDSYVVDRAPRRAAKLFVHDDRDADRRHGEVRWIAPDKLPVLDDLGYRSSLVVPLISHGVVRGDLVCHWTHRTRAFDPFTLGLLEELARRAAIAIENAQMYRRQQRIADEVQKALLPTALPNIDGYVFDAVYSPSENDVEVGGDWFDAFPLPDGRIMLSIGDVFGHGLHAAVVMSSIRHGLRVLALQQSQPDRMLQVIDEALSRDYPHALASAVVAVIDPESQALTYAIAGHPSPLLRTPDGEVIALHGAGVPLGVRRGMTPNVQTVALPLGAMLVLYTDGLIEATRNVLEGERRLRGALRDGAILEAPHPAETLKRFVLEDGTNDDVAVLTVRVRSAVPQRTAAAPTPQWVFRADDARSAEDARAGFVAFLKTRGVPDANYAAAELVFGELIGNVVRHAPGPITIELDWNANAPVLHVIDRGSPYDVRAALPNDILSESGRGLFLISVLADDFAVTPLPGYGNHARVRLKIERLERIAAPP